MKKPTRIQTAEVKKIMAGTASAPGAFRSLVEEQHSRMLEHITCGGTFQVDEETASSQDWQSTLLDAVCELSHECRYDESDPVVIKSLRQKLAVVVATCEAWDKQLIGQAS